MARNTQLQTAGGGAAGGLSERQAAVLRAMVTAYLAGGEPIGSATLSHLVPLRLSPASIRNTMAELSELGLIEQPHVSAGRLPTERGLRLFVEDLLPAAGLRIDPYEQRRLATSLDEAGAVDIVSVASQLLSEGTRQLGFVVSPRLDRMKLRHLSLVRLSSERLLVVLVSRTGAAHRRVIEDRWDLGQGELDRAAALLNERVVGLSLGEIRERLAREAASLKRRADRALQRAVELGRTALEAEPESSADLVIATRLALLDQPEFQDPRRVRELFAALETKELLLEVLDRVVRGDGVSVAIAPETEASALRHCALVATRYGDDSAPLGTLGVIGPLRMDYARVIPLVEYLSLLITEKLAA